MSGPLLSQAVASPTAPQGNVTQISHKYVITLRRPLRDVTKSLKLGEAGQP
jgi:hypothetical protein